MLGNGRAVLALRNDRLNAASSRNDISAAIGSGGLVLACGPVEVRWKWVSVRLVCELLDSSLVPFLRSRCGELWRTRMSRVSQSRRIDSSCLSSRACSRSSSSCSRLYSRSSCFDKKVISQSGAPVAP